MAESHSSRILKEYGMGIALAVLFALLVRAFVVEGYRVPTTSMRPSILPGDFVFVSKWKYLFNPSDDPAGSVITYSRAGDRASQFIKRIIARPGQRVHIQNHRIEIDNVLLPFEEASKALGPGCGYETNGEKKYPVCFGQRKLAPLSSMVLNSKQLLVMSDNRDPQVTGTPYELIEPTQIRSRPLWIWLSIDPEKGGIRKERLFRRVD